MSKPRLVFEGNIGNIETKTFESQKTKTTISLACQDRVPGKEENETHWYAIEVWNLSADFLSLLDEKAKSIYGSGVLSTSVWEDAGQKKSRVFIETRPSDIHVAAFKQDKEQAS